MEWKALANAIIHDGFVPGLKTIYIVCEKCKNPFLHVVIEEIFERRESAGTRISYYLTVCPACGNKEFNIIGTHILPSILPEKVLPFIGHFMIFSSELQRMNMVLDAAYKNELPLDNQDQVK
jgi:hypothetical protein